MAVKASAETIREMKNRLLRQSKTLNVLTRVFVAVFVRPALGMTQKAAEFNMLMQKIARLTASPVETLNAALPKLEKLAQTLDNYNSQRIGR